MGRDADAIRIAFQTSRSVADHFPHDLVLQNYMALGALSTIVFYGNNQRWEKTQEDAFQALKTVASRFPDEIKTQRVLAAGAFSAVSYFVKEKHWQRGKQHFWS
jgi:hypothetical protein